MFTTEINKKTQKIKSDPYYKVSSPLDLNQVFKKKEESKNNNINVLSAKVPQSISSG